MQLTTRRVGSVRVLSPWRWHHVLLQNFGLIQFDPSSINDKLIEEVEIDSSKLEEVRLLTTVATCLYGWLQM